MLLLFGSEAQRCQACIIGLIKKKERKVSDYKGPERREQIYGG